MKNGVEEELFGDTGVAPVSELARPPTYRVIPVPPSVGRPDPIRHPSIQAGDSIEAEEARIAVVLHGVVEDCGVKMDRLRALGFSEAVVEIVDALPRRPEETYGQFAERVAVHPVVRVVKLADLLDNLDRSWLRNSTEKEHARLEWYRSAVGVLGGGWRARAGRRRGAARSERRGVKCVTLRIA